MCERMYACCRGNAKESTFILVHRLRSCLSHGCAFKSSSQNKKKFCRILRQRHLDALTSFFFWFSVPSTSSLLWLTCRVLFSSLLNKEKVSFADQTASRCSPSRSPSLPLRCLHFLQLFLLFGVLCFFCCCCIGVALFSVTAHMLYPTLLSVRATRELYAI